MTGYITNMSLQEQIGQLLVVGFPGTTPNQEIIDLIQRHHVGGIILFSRNIQNAQQVFALTQSLQNIAQAAGHQQPLLIAIDQENGIVSRLGEGATIFPGNMALGAIGSEQITHDVAQATGHELKALGINMNLAPVVDVNNNPTNPVIGVRSFGEDPRQVARLAAAAVKGLQSAGVISTLKHFPGHGDTAVDSHLALPTIPYTLERLEKIELLPFRSGIAAGAASVMIAHIYLPHIMQQEALSSLSSHPALPATLSPAVLQGLLRGKLGFDGVIISDCMEMSAVTETVGAEQGSVMALQAGTDLVLVSHLYNRQLGSLAAIATALEVGTLNPAIIQRAAERVLELKARYLSWDTLSTLSTPTALTDLDRQSHQQLSEHAYSLAITLVRNEDALVPLRVEPTERIVVLTQQKNALTRVEDKYFPHEYLVECIRQRHPRVQTIVTALPSAAQECRDILATTSATDIIIMATVNAHLDQHQLELMRCLIQSDRRVIGLAVRNPYDLLAFPQLRTYLVTYEYTQPALAAAVRVLFGEIQPQGHLPVSLPGIYPLDPLHNSEHAPVPGNPKN
jgi:beta-N-acetylhexosaminidase